MGARFRKASRLPALFALAVGDLGVRRGVCRRTVGGVAGIGIAGPIRGIEPRQLFLLFPYRRACGAPVRRDFSAGRRRGICGPARAERPSANGRQRSGTLLALYGWPVGLFTRAALLDNPALVAGSNGKFALDAILNVSPCFR